MFEIIFFNAAKPASILALVISVVNAFLPMQWINEKIFKFAEAEPMASYSENEIEFDTDYSRENPATMEEATKKYVKRMEGKKKTKKPTYVNKA